MDEIKLKPIGVVHSPFKEPVGVPIQSFAAEGIEGSVELFPQYAEGLKDVDGFSHVFLIFYFHLSEKSSLTVTPFLDEHKRGVFSTRAPGRPNHIGLSIARVLKIEGNVMHVKDLDIVDGTPLLDIKPYIPRVDERSEVRMGWLGRNIDKMPGKKDDGRFS